MSRKLIAQVEALKQELAALKARVEALEQAANKSSKPKVK